MFFKIYKITLIITQLLRIVCGNSFLEENYPKSVLEDCTLDTAQLIEKYNYPVETHFATTEDGYILRLHRIPKPKGPPVLLLHGIFDSSSTWIIHRPEKALGYYLSDNGYDVWMGNARGNRYSRNHTTLNPDKDRQYWSFSWHEIGYYDLPAMIDYILERTKFKKIVYFGHSQGATVFFVMASMHPAYNGKIAIMNALNPGAFFVSIKLPFQGLIPNVVDTLRGQILELLPHSDAIFNICFRSEALFSLCLAVMYLVAGGNSNQTNMKMLPVTIAHWGAGTSFKQSEHFWQLVNSGRFCQFDYGQKENLIKYGLEKPPDYPLEKITAPVALYYTRDDNVVKVDDVRRLAKRLPNVVENCLYPYKDWNHLDVVWGIDARKLAHKGMLELMEKYRYKQL